VPGGTEDLILFLEKDQKERSSAVKIPLPQAPGSEHAHSIEGPYRSLFKTSAPIAGKYRKSQRLSSFSGIFSYYS